MQTEKFWLLKALISIMILSDLQSRNITHTLSYLGGIEYSQIYINVKNISIVFRVLFLLDPWARDKIFYFIFIFLKNM